MDVKLKKCPFCGGEAFLQIRDSEGNLHDEDYEKDPGLGSLTRLGIGMNCCWNPEPNEDVIKGVEMLKKEYVGENYD